MARLFFLLFLLPFLSVLATGQADIPEMDVKHNETNTLILPLLARGVIGVGMTIASNLVGGLLFPGGPGDDKKDDKIKEARKKFTKDLVTKLRSDQPHFYYLVCLPGHRYQFPGTEDDDWAVDKVPFQPENSEESFSYNLYAFKSGEFWLEGEGGYENWAYSGRIGKEKQEYKHLVFVPKDVDGFDQVSGAGGTTPSRTLYLCTAVILFCVGLF